MYHILAEEAPDFIVSFGVVVHGQTSCGFSVMECMT